MHQRLLRFLITHRPRKNLDMKLSKGEISEAIYTKLTEKWQAKLNSMQ